MNDFEPRCIDLAHRVNSAMPRFVVSAGVDMLNDRRKSYKRVVELAQVVVDTRNTTAGLVQLRDKVVRL